ncbi:MAG TPA: PIN domain-containing protein [Ginsengibacter sp.]
MNAKIFFDTNVILYSYSILTDSRNTIAKQLISNNHGHISTQVMQEVCNILIKKFKLDEISISKAINEINDNFNVLINNVDTVKDALNIHFKYSYSYYDSLIIASALQNQCSILYSEDLHHNQKIYKSLTIINPFI